MCVRDASLVPHSNACCASFCAVLTSRRRKRQPCVAYQDTYFNWVKAVSRPQQDSDRLHRVRPWRAFRARLLGARPEKAGLVPRDHIPFVVPAPSAEQALRTVPRRLSNSTAEVVALSAGEENGDDACNEYEKGKLKLHEDALEINRGSGRSSVFCDESSSVVCLYFQRCRWLWFLVSVSLFLCLHLVVGCSHASRV